LTRTTDRWRIRVRVRREEERQGEDEKRRGGIGKVGRRSTRSCAVPIRRRLRGAWERGRAAEGERLRLRSGKGRKER
jgi:hypothetical protein